MVKKPTTKEKKIPKPAPKAKAVDPMQNMDESTLAGQIAKLSSQDFTKLTAQVQSEYTYGWWYIRPKWEEWGLRLKLYNNQRRDKAAVGDPLLFSVFNTVFASLYNDRLSVAWQPREEGDIETAENLNDLAEFDYGEMGKDVLDYEWDWDTCFFGRGLCCFMEFDRDMQVPIPEVWDPMTVIRDPDAKSVQGNIKGQGKARFLYREVRKTKQSLRDAKIYFNIDKIKPDGVDINSLVDGNAQLRNDAQGRANLSNFANIEGENKTYRLLEGFTVWNGKLVFLTLANDRRTVIRYTELGMYKKKQIPVIDRSLYPIAHDWDGVSIPDMVEDKQRARAVVINVALQATKANAHPMYLFNKNKIENRADLNFEINKQIPIDGDPTNVVVPMQKDRIQQDVEYILNTLGSAAQQATATPAIEQGAITESKRTATELTLVTQSVDNRYSLSIKIFGWSERRFWAQWYFLYKQYFADRIDKKTIRISGILGPKFRPLRRENIIAKIDPDVMIESKTVADAERFNKMQRFQAVISVVLQDPNSNRRYAEKEFARLSGMKKDQIDMLLPPTLDEVIAEQENIKLEENEQVDVDINQDHRMHIEVHNKLSDTPAKKAHIEAHMKAMLVQKVNPAFPAQPSAVNPIGQTQEVNQDVIRKPATNDQPVVRTR